MSSESKKREEAKEKGEGRKGGRIFEIAIATGVEWRNGTEWRNRTEEWSVEERNGGVDWKLRK